MAPVLQMVADPTLVYALFVAGCCATLTELAHPGALVPGVAGALLLLLAGIGFAVLPVNWLSLALIILALALFGVDAMVTAHGGPTIAGMAAFAAGSLTLFNVPGNRSPAISPALLVPIMLLGVAFCVLLVRAAGRVRRVPAMNGPQRLLGATGVVRSDLHPVGTVLVGGELWSARVRRPALGGPQALAVFADAAATLPLLRPNDGKSGGVQELPAGQAVRIVGRRGLVLEVEPVAPTAGDASGAA